MTTARTKVSRLTVIGAAIGAAINRSVGEPVELRLAGPGGQAANAPSRRASTSAVSSGARSSASANPYADSQLANIV